MLHFGTLLVSLSNATTHEQNQLSAHKIIRSSAHTETLSYGIVGGLRGGYEMQTGETQSERIEWSWVMRQLR